MQVGGLETKELNDIELLVLKALDWHVIIRREVSSQPKPQTPNPKI
jgi:hypothetical protein